jgi:hypothetical protein
VKNCFFEKFYKICHFYSPRVENDIKVIINSAVELGFIHVLVFGKFGIAFGTRIDCGKQRSCQMILKTTNEMIPKAKIVVYEFKKFKDKVRVGSTTILFDDFSKNDVS